MSTSLYERLRSYKTNQYLKHNFMRRTLFAFTALLFTIVACAQKEKPETIEGNGNVVTKEIAVSAFDALKVGTVAEVKLIQGAKEGVKIEADENLQVLFDVRNEGNKLVIDTKKMNNKNIKSKTKMKVYVTFKSLKNIELSTIGNITADNTLSFDDVTIKNSSVGNVDLKLTASTLNLTNNSVGQVTLSGKADNAVVKNNGVGSLKAGDFAVQTMDIENGGVGSAEVNAAKSLKVKDSFLGKVKNKGAAPVRKMNHVTI
jgi:hypothetical protein